MQKRIIVQAVFARDGLVIKIQEELRTDELKALILAAIPAEHVSPGLEIFDEADDDVESRAFADSEDLQHGRVMHVGCCRDVSVVVRYAGRVAERHFPPATRIGRIKRWAVNKLGINPADANELVLQVAGTSIQPTRDQHVGNFIEHGTCNVVLDLVRSYTVNGDGSVGADHARLLEHLDEGPFVMGEMGGRWRLRDITWPFVFVDIIARDKRQFTLRLQCAGYPSSPTGAFWDVVNSGWLPAQRWPRAGARFGVALRSDWQGGTALYIPCDRNSITGHEQWLQLHPAWAWDPAVGIARYLEVVWTMLNGDDYVAPAA
ncbi:Uncharacterised protein [Burkholderia pseudomallei]|nr:Uncharacterised protein [Burkholderia pseudomallei]CAJ8196652.1 Uncharacterised protein [Burkholderia pseudomallei]CAJ8936727.1 Uncharacterised protein [Burkholderia pseudomallei]